MANRLFTDADRPVGLRAVSSPAVAIPPRDEPSRTEPDVLVEATEEPLQSDSCYDVVVIGASLAGCAAAILLSRADLSVALVDRCPDPTGYKIACTHFIQASATPTLRRLGLDTAIEAAGGIRNQFDLWTRWGWIRSPRRVYGPGPALGYSIRRKVLDPLMRRVALEANCVEGLLGRSVAAIRPDNDHLQVTLTTRAGGERRLRTALLVGADGRDSSVARLAGMPVAARVNHRFIYWAYFRGLPVSEDSRARFWHMDPDIAYALPNDDGLTLVVVMPASPWRSAFRTDRETAFEQYVRRVPEMPTINDAQRVSPLLGRIDIANLRRPPAAHRIALIGDAALACDPLPGVGCGWALQSAEWLADCVVPAWRTNNDIRGGLTKYADRHRRETADHYDMISALSRATAPRLHERILLGAATSDEELAARIMALWQRRIQVSEYLTASTFARSAAVVGRAAVRRTTDQLGESRPVLRAR